MTMEDRALKFEPKGSEMALALINRTTREGVWRVNVAGTLTNDNIAVTNIALQN